jgi:hypothetical protein
MIKSFGLFYGGRGAGIVKIKKLDHRVIENRLICYGELMLWLRYSGLYFLIKIVFF